MANMHPEDIENYGYTYSELKLYNALKEQLADKYHVFYSVRWFETVEGKRVDSECDFLIFDPGFGFLTIEVKGGTKIDIINRHWSLTETDDEGNINTRQLKESPFSQAEKSMRYFHKYFSNEFLQSFNGVYGFAVCFPMFQIDQKIEGAAEKSLIIDIRDMDTLAHRINEIFHYWRNRRNTVAPFSNDQKQRFILMVNKQISLSAAAGALIPIKEKELLKINLIQDSIIDFLTNYRQVQIVGGAGTGKTFMAMKKMKREAYLGHKVLYICKSRELAAYVGKLFDKEDNVKCREFLMLMQDLLKMNVDEGAPFFDLLKRNPHEYFDAIIIDEGQDFSVDEALAVRQLLKRQKDSVLYVFLDKNQNLFDVNFDSAFSINEKPYILRYNIRNTGEIYKYAIEKTGLGDETIANSLLGVVPEIRDCKNRIQAVSAISNIVNRLVQKEYVKTSSIVILSDLPYEHSVLNSETKIGAYKLNCTGTEIKEDSILFRTVSDFKGLEADIVIYLRHSKQNDIDKRVKKREDYVGYTRARYYLYIIDTKVN